MSFLKAMIDGKTFYELGFIFLRESQRPVLPKTRDRTASIPGLDGEIDFGARLESRDINLELSPRARTADDLTRQIDALTAILTDQTGRPRSVELVLPEHTGRRYMVRYSGSLPVDRIVGAGKFTLPLVAFDPYAYQITDTSGPILLDSDIELDSDIRFDDGFTYAVTGPATVEVNNFGSIDLYPVIQIGGSFTTLTLTANGQTMSYNEALASGTLTIDCKKMQARFGSVNKNNKVTGKWLKLMRGINTVQIGGTGLKCSVSFVFRPMFL